MILYAPFEDKLSDFLKISTAKHLLRILSGGNLPVASLKIGLQHVSKCFIVFR